MIISSHKVQRLQAVMTDPVVLGGVTYERAAAEVWLADHGAVAPEDGRPLQEANLVPNHALRGILQTLANTQPGYVSST